LIPKFPFIATMPLSQDEYADQDDNVMFVAIKKKDWREASACMDQYADSRDNFGNAPLHAALGFKAPDQLLMELIQRNPDACKVHGTDDWLPLHVAAMWGSSSKIMEILIRQYPEALDDCGQGGVKGKTPRHYSRIFPGNRALLEKSTEEWQALAANGSFDGQYGMDNNMNREERRTSPRQSLQDMCVEQSR
jgi:hypothetical protein